MAELMNKWKCAGLQVAEKRREGRVSFSGTPKRSEFKNKHI